MLKSWEILNDRQVKGPIKIRCCFVYFVYTVLISLNKMRFSCVKNFFLRTVLWRKFYTKTCPKSFITHTLCLPRIYIFCIYECKYCTQLSFWANERCAAVLLCGMRLFFWLLFLCHVVFLAYLKWQSNLHFGFNRWTQFYVFLWWCGIILFWWYILRYIFYMESDKTFKMRRTKYYSWFV